jgi:AraC-like DNA-binding protein
MTAKAGWRGQPIQARLPGLDNLSVAVSIASFSRLDSSWQAAVCSPPHGRIYLITEGAAWMQVGRRKYDLLPGRIYHVPAGVPFGHGCPHSLAVYWLHYTARVYGTIDLGELAPAVVRREAPDLAATASVFERLICVHRQPDPASALETAALLLSLLHPFLSRTEPGPWQRPALQRLKPALDHVDTCLDDRLPVTQLAALTNLTRAHFSVEFRKALGLSPRRYIQQRRMERALHLLRSTDQTVGDIGRALGFCDGFHFSKTFKRQNGVSPTDYRRGAEQP